MKNTLRAAALTIVTALVLTGCIKVDMSLTLNEDDTVDGSYVLAVAEGVGDLMESTDEEAAQELFGDSDELAGDFGDATVEAYTEEGWIGTKVSFTGEPLSGFDQSEDGFTIVREGDEFVVSGTNDVTEGEEAPDGAEMTLSITFPGEVTETNGTVEGTTVTWDLTTATTMEARGGATEGGSFPFWIIGLILAVLVLIIAAVVVTVLVTRKKGEPVGASTGDPAAPATDFAPEPAAEFTPGPEEAIAADEAGDETPAPKEPTDDESEEK